MTRVERNQMTYSQKISDATYDHLRRAAELILPASAALYFTLSTIWGLPYGEQVVGTIAATNTFVGVLVMAMRRQYNNSDARFDGDIVVDETDDVKTFGLVLNGDPDEIEQKKEIIFKVLKND